MESYIVRVDSRKYDIPEPCLIAKVTNWKRTITKRYSNASKNLLRWQEASNLIIKVETACPESRLNNQVAHGNEYL